MPANTALQETDLIDAAIQWLRESLPESWSVEPSNLPSLVPAAPEDGARADAVLEVQAGGMLATMVVEAKKSFGPRDVERLLAGATRLLRRYSKVQFLVVAPWLSERARELLVKDGINYYDLTANAYLRLENPAAFIKTTGAQRNPSPRPRGAAQVRGPGAARLIRFLADVRPPYGVREVAEAAKLNPGYVSRLLDALDTEALVERGGRGRIESVDVGGLIRRWAEWYDLFSNNRITKYTAPQGPRKLVENLKSRALPGLSPSVPT